MYNLMFVKLPIIILYHNNCWLGYFSMIRLEFNLAFPLPPKSGMLNWQTTGIACLYEPRTASSEEWRQSEVLLWNLFHIVVAILAYTEWGRRKSTACSESKQQKSGWPVGVVWTMNIVIPIMRNSHRTVSHIWHGPNSRPWCTLKWSYNQVSYPAITDHYNFIVTIKSKQWHGEVNIG